MLYTYLNYIYGELSHLSKGNLEPIYCKISFFVPLNIGSSEGSRTLKTLVPKTSGFAYLPTEPLILYLYHTLSGLSIYFI